jgi:hypothetical protein
MWSAASPDGAVRGSRLDLPPLTVWSTSSIPRPDLPPHRRRCLQLAVAGHHDSLLQFFQRSFQGCNRGYVVAAEPSSDTSVVMPPGAFSCLSGPSPSVHASSCKQPQPPSVPRWWGFPVWAERRREGGRSRTTCYGIGCYRAGRSRSTGSGGAYRSPASTGQAQERMSRHAARDYRPANFTSKHLLRER